MENEINKITTEIVKTMERNIIKDKNTFSIEYIPKILKFRDKYVKKLLEKIAKGCLSLSPSNINIWGATGTGKTITIKYCFQKAEEIWSKANINGQTIYVPCSEYNTQSKAFSRILGQLGRQVPIKGIDRGTYIDYIKEMIEKVEYLTICFDEIDILVKNNLKNQDFLFSLANISKINFVFISNNPYWNKFLDSRIRSRIQFEDMEFEPYSNTEMKGILLQRIELGLTKNIFSDDILDYIVTKAYFNRSDLRDVIKLLYIVIEEIQSKLLSYEQNSDTNSEIDYINKLLTKEFINSCYFKLIERETIRIINGLPPSLHILLIYISYLKLYKPNSKITSQLLHTIWNTSIKNSKIKPTIFEPVGLRTIQNNLNQLKQYQLIDYGIKGHGRGQPTECIIEPLFNPQLILEYLYTNTNKSAPLSMLENIGGIEK
jgi:Cdc6-like AAA superfamily ATPase